MSNIVTQTELSRRSHKLSLYQVRLTEQTFNGEAAKVIHITPAPTYYEGKEIIATATAPAVYAQLTGSNKVSRLDAYGEVANMVEQAQYAKNARGVLGGIINELGFTARTEGGLLKKTEEHDVEIADFTSYLEDGPVEV